MFQIDVSVISQKKIKKDYSLLECEAPSIARSVKPGQFVHIYCPVPGAFFRRPFSVAGVSGKIFSIIYKCVGPGTGFLSGQKKGDKLNVMGPLGVPYRLPAKKENVIFIAGGSGIASLNFLAEAMKPGKGTLFCGAGCKDELVLTGEFKARGWDVRLSTDDGSKGFKGVVSDLFKKEAGGLLKKDTIVYMCGPCAMMKAFAPYLISKGIRFFVSMETVMACGIGVCQGCAVSVVDQEEYRLVCKDGAVMDGAKIDWEKL